MKNSIETLPIDAQKVLLEQTEKKYNLLLADDQSIRSKIQSINAISIGLIVLLVSIIHNKDWDDQANNYFVALVIFMLYNAIVFFLPFLMRPQTGAWYINEIVSSLNTDDPNNIHVSAIYFSRILYYEAESNKLIRSSTVIRNTFLTLTIVFGFAIVGFYYFTYWA